MLVWKQYTWFVEVVLWTLLVMVYLEQMMDVLLKSKCKFWEIQLMHLYQLK